MPYDSSGSASVTRNIAVTGQTVLAEQVNVPFADIQAMLGQVLLRSGIAPWTGNQNANGFSLTNLGEGSNSGDSVNFGQFQSAIQGLATVPTGAVQGFRRKTAPAGWITESGGTIGNATSGATNRANADTSALFALLWADFSNAELPIQDSGGLASTRGASAAADFAANKRLTIHDSRSRFHRGADAGIGVGLAQEDAIKAHSHTGTTAIGGEQQQAVTSSASATAVTGNIQPTLLTLNTGGGTSYLGAIAPNPHTHTFTTNNTGDTETRPKSSAVLYCIKL